MFFWWTALFFYDDIDESSLLLMWSRQVYLPNNSQIFFSEKSTVSTFLCLFSGTPHQSASSLLQYIILVKQRRNGTAKKISAYLNYLHKIWGQCIKVLQLRVILTNTETVRKTTDIWLELRQAHKLSRTEIPCIPMHGPCTHCRF